MAHENDRHGRALNPAAPWTHRRSSAIRLSPWKRNDFTWRQWFNDTLWRPWKGFAVVDGRWRYVGASALAVSLCGAAVVVGGLGHEAHKPQRAAASLAGFAAPREATPEAVTTTTSPPTTAPPVTRSRPPAGVRGSSPAGGGRCGGDLPPCSVMMCESGGKVVDTGPMTRWGTAKGKWQILDSTWGNYKGYPNANAAPESVQDERARQIYKGGAGRGQWDC